MDFNNIKNELFSDYLKEIPNKLQENFNALEEAEISTDTFSFYTSVASVYSSKIEGEDIDIDSYIKHKKFGISFLPDYTKKIDDLYNAYTFAKTNVLNKTTISKAHQLLSKHLVAKHWQGKLRTTNMYVTSPDGKIEYVAALPQEVEAEMKNFYRNIELLLKQKLTLQEVFFFASIIHLVFVKIHPFNDGNGRCGRLFEKWFLGQKLGEKAWFVPSERNYYEQHQIYYNNLRKLGLEYTELNYSKALPFLLMLPNSLPII
ncbi:MAG: Fic family protein [Vicingaceae bacterium]|nr:Fic family protein [Vicingaceae bacterium]